MKTGAKTLYMTIATLAFGFLGAGAHAQEQLEVASPMSLKQVDQNFIDRTGNFVTYSTPGVSVGVEGQGGLSFRRTFRNGTEPNAFSVYNIIAGQTNYKANNGQEWTDNLTGSIGGTFVASGLGAGKSAITNVTGGGVSHLFLNTDPTLSNPSSSVEFAPYRSTGATLIFDGLTTYTLTGGDGSVYTYTENIRTRRHTNPSNPNQLYIGFGEITAPNGEAASKATLLQIQRPSGEIITYHYKLGSPAKSPLFNQEAWWRLQSVTNNYGYQIHFEYKADGTPTSLDWLRITKATAINNNIDTCDPNANVCTGLTHSWPTENYEYTSTYQYIDNPTTLFDSFTDALGRKTVVTYGTVVLSTHSDTVRMESITFPGSASPNVEFQYPDAARLRVSKVVRGSEYTDYEYHACTIATPHAECSNHPASSSGVISIATDASGGKSYVFSTEIKASKPANPASLMTVDRLILKSRNENGDETDIEYNILASDQYNNFGTVKKVTSPEGNRVEYAYDTRGNLTTTTGIAKSGSGLSNIVTSAAYPGTCTNLKICNKPTSTTDANGNTTNYTYNTTHGGVTSIKAPDPDSSGPLVRPETRIIYTSKSGTSGTVYKVAAQTACATTSFAGAYHATLSNANNDCNGGTGDETVTVTAYGASGAGFLLPTMVTTKAGNGVVSSITTTSYTHAGDIDTVNGPLAGGGDTTRNIYDAMRRPIGVIQPQAEDGTYRATRTTYHSYGGVELVEQGTVPGQTDANWASFTRLESVKTAYYADTGRQKSVAVYDGASSTAIKALTHFSYDNLGRLDCAAVRMDPADFNSAFPASACTFMAKETDDPAPPYGTDRITKNTYTAASELKDTITGYGVTTANGFGETLQQTTRARTYSDNGQLASIADAKGNKTWYTYDGFDRLKRTCYPPESGAQIASQSACASQTGSVKYEEITSYDAAGNVLEQRKRDGSLVKFQYDALNRLTKRELPGAAPDDHYCYDSFDRMVDSGAGGTSCTAGRTIHNTYDQLSRMKTQTTALGEIEYGYDAAGRRLWMEWPDNKRVSYYYDNTGAMGRICALGDQTVQSCPAGSVILVAKNDYDSLGRLDLITWGAGSGNGASTNYAYDGASRLTSLAHQGMGADGVTYSITRYNPASQIAGRSITNNDYRWTNPVYQTDNFASNGLNQYTSAGAVNPITHDARGNMENDGVNDYVYDAVNRLTSANSGAVTLTYDASDRLYEIATSGGGARRFLYDGSTLIAEYDGTGALLRRYVSGAGVDNPIACFDGGAGATQKCLPGIDGTAGLAMLTDERGTVVAYADSAGVVQHKNIYNAFGQQKSANEGTYRYTGQTWLPELDLYYYKARLYHPDFGRFMQTDPIGYEDQMNLYAYVANDPMNLTDPSGLEGIPGFFSFFDFGGADALVRNQEAIINAGIAGANGPGDRTNFGPTLGETVVGNSSLALFEANVNAAANVALIGTTEGAGSVALPARTVLKTVRISASKSPQAAQHLVDAGATGVRLTVDRAGAAARRAEALKGTPTRRGFDRDEVPPAIFREGGEGSSVRLIDPSDNRSAGGQLGYQLRDVPNGGCVIITVCR